MSLVQPIRPLAGALSSGAPLGTGGPAADGLAAAGARGAGPTPAPAPGADSEGSFLEAIGSAVGSLNEQLLSADRASTLFAAGGDADLHTVMLEMQHAAIGLQVGVAVRDKLLDAYQQLMHLQL